MINEILHGEEAVAAAFLHHRGDRFGPLDQSDVDAILDAAFSEGIRPTVELVRQIAGGGSPNTIHPRIADWYRRMGPKLSGGQRKQAKPVPPKLLTLWEAVSETALASAKESLQADLAGVEQAKQDLAAREAALASEAARLDAEREAAQRVADSLKSTLEGLRADNAALQEALDSARDALAGDAMQLGEQRASISQLQADLAASRDLAAGLKKALKEESAALAVEREGSAILRHELSATQSALDASENQRAALDGSLALAGEALQESREQTATARKDAESITAELSSVRATHTHTVSELADAKAHIHSLMAKLAERSEDAARSEALLTERTAECERLRQQVDGLSALQKILPMQEALQAATKDALQRVSDELAGLRKSANLSTKPTRGEDRHA